MRPIRVTVAAAAKSSPIPLDTYADPFNVGIAVLVSSPATLTYTVQYTYDNVFANNYNPEAATSTWFDMASMQNKSASSDSNFAYPVVACRLHVTAHTTGTATLTVVQAGMPGK